MNLSTTDEVPCNGPCRKRFRALNMDQATASVLLSSGRTSGLQWLCPACHQAQTFNPQYISAIRYGTDLPPELWIMIFRYLGKRSLLQVRLTCHRWKEIVVQNQSLAKKFCVVFDGQCTMDEQFRPENLFPASRAEFCTTWIISVDGWWPSFGAGLTELCISSCRITLPVLLGMLKKTPNLTCLSLGHVESTSAEEINVDFRLEKLECLSCAMISDVYGNIFTRLRELNLEIELENGEDEKVCRVLQSVQGTLQQLDCQLTPFMMEQMASMDRLQLKKVAVRQAVGDLVVELSQIQGSIEHLVVIATVEDLCKIGRNLTKLKEISSIMVDCGTPSFLAEMRQLKVLDLEGFEEDRWNFEQFGSATLTSLKLNKFSISGLQRFLTNCPNLQELQMFECVLDSWSDVFAARFESLRRLHLGSSSVLQNVMNVPAKLKCLKKLRISSCDICAEMLVELLQQCPRLEKLKLFGMSSIDDKFVGILGQFPQLRKLQIFYCAITDKSLQLIAENYSHLNVDIKSRKISDAAIKLFRYATRSV
ncbi:uncharacterized protein LOC119767013 [Culex quinquefasciatus]|uniref:uncharacterized protein LOC119767013 n=1 Tax=Culex quinquefasciatus TaxID=7176 RepID=UPI0018E363AF|nr:uncharacterized protein LOC119767013 [Culex quinquefasciatus]XP_038110136.1 uncharacterized protein LOC119767013 [Culex quinquefasciatus]